jgi:hypothetical protein
MIPQQTPRTDFTSKGNSTPQKFKSPGSTMRDLTQSLENASMSSPAKDSANSSINPQSHNNAKGRK